VKILGNRKGRDGSGIFLASEHLRGVSGGENKHFWLEAICMKYVRRKIRQQDTVAFPALFTTTIGYKGFVMAMIASAEIGVVVTHCSKPACHLLTSGTLMVVQHMACQDIPPVENPRPRPRPRSGPPPPATLSFSFPSRLWP
jgi:hypothetical protein